MTQSFQPTIVALSSAPGRAGVAVVRISGARTRFAIETISGTLPPPRIASLRKFRDRAGETIDQGLLLYFPGPASFTGEDVAELHLHGSQAVLAAMLSTLTALPGIRLAEAGEFTRRALEAGKLDLAEVEGLADLIDSETEWQRRQALRQMEGALGRQAASWRSLLIEAATALAADLDFSDEGDVGGPLQETAVELARQVLASLRQALGSFAAGERVRDGFVVVLAGPPNAGKSSLLNALARRDVAIVSPVAGTTRDAIEVRLDLGGLPVILVDTAGLRESADPVEIEGIRRARALAERADLLLSLRAIDSPPFQLPDAVRSIAIATKCDLGGAARDGELPVSAMTGQGLPDLLARIAEMLGTSQAAEPALLTRERHRQAVFAAVATLERAVEARHGHNELVAEDIRVAIRELERLVGRVGVEDVLDQIFAGFCIGK
ncbi:tRNA uridine-5-carboxymethylaminomethyl(34) synthesis GTPase MnmE [Bosea sp. (in: a-proteobacteria)]|uniref:tRNA uridine-5-carboxymethylaminomethyl(34) synthesis GTPase MnmE n=1 Tax=Bosea sp. (in: a-proteobacteria) TaxID=1871050 RepID=UPI0012159CD5|nr:tRNA uridine-5-carboxymethylaminomethyl(34) synthesis GTPase MnmE [Bosea sp. (in: a-proteobacteria)]TAJ34389.1 MAG: tRNA uridine-5-carboxymethylaminomethyl(34) synthesis GTPase MnmE [Bosea sp. (in: a-proteobacteria)]